MKAELRDSLEFLFPDSTVAARPCRSLELDVARGGTVSAHVLLNDLKPGASLRMRVNGLRNAQWFRLVDVPVEANTGPRSFIEKEGEKNRYVIRRAPFRVYDAMEPVGRSVQVTSPTTVLRLHIPIARQGRRGPRAYTLALQCGREECTLKLKVNVYRAMVTPVGERSLPYTNWFSYELIAERHGIKLWSPEYWPMLRKYADLMVHGRQNMFWVPLRNIFSVRRGKPVLELERLERIVKIFTKAGMHFIEGGHVARRTGEEWHAPTFDAALTGGLATSVKGNSTLAEVGRQLMEAIDRNKWQPRWIQHVTDEPTENNATDYRILVGMVRKYMPGLPILDATMDPALVGSVNIWCPQAQAYQKDRAQFERQRKLGDQIWYYTCCVPGGPWLNRLLDMELLRPALIGWGAALYDLQGYLHWGLNHYRPEQDPFKQSVVKHGSSSFLPAGDTHIVYPGTRGPWSSLRMEAHREGFEDYELFKQVRLDRQEWVDEIVAMAMRNFKQYTKDVKVFRKARRWLLKALG